MQIWSSEIKEVEKLYDSFKGNLPLLEKEVEQLIKTEDANVAMLYSRRSLEVIVTDLCEAELKRPRKTQPLKGIIDKLNYEEKVPSHIITSMDGLNSLSTFGAHPSDFDPEQVKPVLNNLTTVIKWYLKYRNLQATCYSKLEEPGTVYSSSLFSSPSQYSKKKILLSSLLAMIILALGYFIVHEISRVPKEREKTIAVLPFININNDPGYSFLESAMPEEISNQLSKIGQFKVRGSTSLMQYSGLNKKSSKIGNDLKVNYLIKGSIQNIEDKIRIRVMLIDAVEDYQIWGDNYDRSWTNFSSFQGEIAKQIAERLQAELSPEEVKKIEKQSTRNSDAYKEFLSGNSLFNDARFYYEAGKRYNDSSSFENAIKAYDKAILYDSTFALAYAKRSISRSWGYHTGDLDNSNIDKCKSDIDKAIKLDPEMPEGYIALGFYFYYCKDEFIKAVESFQKAADLEPGNTEPLFYMGVVYRRLGDWEKSCRFMTAGLMNNFSNAVIITNIGITYDYLRNYDSSMIYHKKAIEAMPGWPDSYGNLIETCLLKNGRTEEAKTVLDSAIVKTGKSFLQQRIEIDIYNGKYSDALGLLKNSSSSAFEDPGKWLITYAQVYGYLNRNKDAFQYYDSARIYYNSELAKDPQSSYVMSSLGLAYAGLKDKDKSIKYGEDAVTLTENDMVTCPDRKIDLAKSYVITGEFDKAIKLVSDLLNHPACFSIKLLQLDPVWRTLIKHPDFQKIVKSNQVIKHSIQPTNI